MKKFERFIKKHCKVIVLTIIAIITILVIIQLTLPVELLQKVPGSTGAKVLAVITVIGGFILWILFNKE